MKRFLVTGGTGFLGGILICELMRQGHSVVVLARTERKAKQLLSKFNSEEIKRITIIKGDITHENLGQSLDFINENKSSIDAVYHLAAMVKFDEELEGELMHINLEGTKNTLKFSEKLGVKHFIQVSTAYTLGKEMKGVEELYAENQDCHNPYELSKVYAEREVMSYKDKMKVNIVRPSIIVGDSKTGQADSNFAIYGFLRALSVFKKRALRDGYSDESFRIIASAHGTSNLVPIDYVVKVLLAVHALGDNGQIFHVTNPKPPSNQHILNRIKFLMQYDQLTITTDPSIGLDDLTIKERMLNELLWIYKPYLATDKSFDDRHTQIILKRIQELQLDMDDEMIDLILASGLD
jgi:nucleoside-diphosphate-sugar epimerase